MNTLYINKIKKAALKSILIALPLGGVGGGLLCSCSDWDDHYDGDGVEGSNTTLWQQLSQRSDLSDFAEVLQQTKVFRQHKKTATSYADVLDGGQSLTVMAPVNGTFNKDSLLNVVQTAAGDSAVEHFFVMNHLTRTPRSAVESSFRLLNNKRVYMTSTDISGIGIKESNVRCKNGILHVLDSEIPYNHTIYETLTQIDGFKAAGQAISFYNKDYFDEDASVSSGLVDGIPVYVDSVVNERNKMMESVGLLNAEDSDYIVAIPTDEGWNKAYAEASSYFKFSNSIEKADSLQRYYTTHALLEDAIYSMTIQKSPLDSLITYEYSNSKPEYDVFHKPYSADGILGKAKGARSCSNGNLYYYDEWPYTPQQTYFKKIEQEGEYYGNIVSYSLCSYNTRSLRADSISKGAYLDIVHNGGNSNWKVKYKLSNTLAGKYDVCVVVLPKTIEDPDANTTRPNKFKVAINYLDENGDEQSYNCENATFSNDPAKVDTIVVAEDFEFPVSNYGQSNDKFNIELQCYIRPQENAKYNREMYLDCIFLRPKK